MKDFSVSVKISNNQLRARRLALGMNKRELADAAHMNQASYGLLENLKISPLRKKGEWRETALALANFHKCLPEDLFPKSVMLVKKSEVVAEFDLEQLPFASLDVDELPSLLPSPEEEVMNKSLITKALEVLTPREKKVISERFGLDGNEENPAETIAINIGATRQTVKNIQTKALHKMLWRLKNQLTPQSKMDETAAVKLDKEALAAHEKANILEKSNEIYLGYCYPHNSIMHRNANSIKNDIEHLRNQAQEKRAEAKELRRKLEIMTTTTSSGKTYNG